jgi:hypothetical protein
MGQDQGAEESDDRSYFLSRLLLLGEEKVLTLTHPRIC